MIAGMVPMALGLGEGGEQTAPLGRAVIGGLVAATLRHAVRAAVRVRAGPREAPGASPASLDPDDPESPSFMRREVPGPATHPSDGEPEAANLAGIGA